MFSDFRTDGDQDEDYVFEKTGRSAYDGRGFDDELGGYAGRDDGDYLVGDDEEEEEEEGVFEDEIGAPEDDDDEEEWWEEDEHLHQDEGQWIGPAAPQTAARAAAAPVTKKLPWRTRKITLCVPGSLSAFNKDASLASISIEDELKGLIVLKDLKESKDFLGGIRVVKGRNAFRVTIGIGAEMLDDKGHNKIEGNLIAKGQTRCLSFDLYPKASITPTNPEIIMPRPEEVKKPILSQYKNHPDRILRKYADPSRLWEGISNNPSSDRTKFVFAKHPVMVEMEKAARRRCAYLGKPYNRQNEFGAQFGGNYSIDEQDIKRQIRRLQEDYSKVNYVSDLPRLTLSLVRTQLTDANAHRSQLRTNWRDAAEIGVDLDATDEGVAELERRLNEVNKSYFTLEYDYLPHDMVPSAT